MHKSIHKNITLMLLSVVLAIGCSGGGSPLSPSSPPEKSDVLPVIAFTSNDDVFTSMGLFGAYQLSLSPDGSQVDLISSRTSSIGESYIVNGINFFAITPCANCLKIKSIALTESDYLLITFDIRHPFLPGDPFKPPTAMNRLDLDIFDAALLIYPMDSAPKIFPNSNVNIYSDFIVNASGYTKEFFNVIGDNAAIPYTLVVDDHADNTNTFNKFAMGDRTEFDVLFDIDEQLNFELYLTMGYGASARRPERLDPTYYNPEFNRKAAWKVLVTPAHGDDLPDSTNTWNETNPNAAFDITVKVFDWQIGANVDSNLSNTTDVFAASEVVSVILEIPGMHNTQNMATVPVSGTGMPDDPLIYTFSIANENLLGAGEYTGLVKVLDSRVPGESIIGGETDTLADSIDGINLQWVNIPEFATYQTFPAFVLSSDAITVLSPDDGDILIADTIWSIEWSGATGIDNVRIEYSKDDFSMDINIIEESVENNGEYLWEVPADESDTVKVRISAVGFPWVNGLSDGYFTISADAVEPVGDLSVISINRGEGGVNHMRITSVDFDWDDSLRAVEYAFERKEAWIDSDWTVIGTSTTSDFNFVPEGNDLDHAFLFRVISRAVPGGDPNTDADPSQQVFILFMSDAGYTSGHTWVRNVKSSSSGLRFTPWWGTASGDGWGPRGAMEGVIGHSSQDTANTWAITHTPHPIPNLEGMKEAFADGWMFRGYNWSPPTLGWTIGTLSEPNPTGETVCDYNPANDIYDDSYWGYNRDDVQGQNYYFCETNQSAWAGINNSTWVPVGYYLNDLLESDRNYIAMGLANGDIPLPGGS